MAARMGKRKGCTQGRKRTVLVWGGGGVGGLKSAALGVGLAGGKSAYGPVLRVNRLFKYQWQFINISTLPLVIKYQWMFADVNKKHHWRFSSGRF